MKKQLEVGNRVIVSKNVTNYYNNLDLKGKTATIVEISGRSASLDFDENIGGHDCEGKAKIYHGWRVPISSIERYIVNTTKSYFGDELAFGEKLRVIYNGNRTVVLLEDGTKGTAKCSDEDDFDKERGLNIAYRRAKIRQMTKELKQLCK